MIRTLLASSLLLPVLAVAQSPDWHTPAEITNYRTTPNYAETMQYIERVQKENPHQVRVENFGKTGEGRDLKIVIVSKDGVFDPAAIHRSGRAILLVQNSIHAGEMDGKDACLALLRELAVTHSKANLLDHVVLVFIPAYNLDGHERRSAYTRINQNGPDEAGWRANATNLNLNRDYMKVDAPESRAFFAMFERWLPDFFVDDHVTDGADFQYDVTFTLDATPTVAPATAEWARSVVTPYVVDAVNASGHVAFPNYIELVDGNNLAKGIGFNQNPPRYSTGEMILENRPGMLVELHMLKDYKTRVTGNYELLSALMQLLNRDAAKLIALNKAADEAATKLPKEPLPLNLAADGTTSPVQFKGFKYTREKSEISGDTWVRYSHEPETMTIPMQTGVKVTATVVPPAGYLIPQQWTQVIDVLKLHGVNFTRLTSAWTGTVELYHCENLKWQARPYEGHHPLFASEFSTPDAGKQGACALHTESVTYPAGTVFVPLNQRLSKVAIHWLEPMAPDSAVSWGFFDSIFEQKEYGEGYVVEKLAREMLAKDPALKAEFEAKLANDPKFAADSYARLNFFYSRSPWYRENRVGDYPVARVVSLGGLPVATK